MRACIWCSLSHFTDSTNSQCLVVARKLRDSPGAYFDVKMHTNGLDFMWPEDRVRKKARAAMAVTKSELYSTLWKSLKSRVGV